MTTWSSNNASVITFHQDSNLPCNWSNECGY